MLFNSYIFIFLFLPITFILYFGLNKFKKYNLAKFVLVLASLYFYAYFNFKYLYIITSSILVNYLINIFFRKVNYKEYFNNVREFFYSYDYEQIFNQ